MNNKVYRVFCEWDIGQELLVFATDGAAERWLKNNPYLHEMAAEEEMSFEDYYQRIVDHCFICIDEYELIQ